MGYLPPGNINLTVVQMSIGRAKNHLWYFIFFAALMEFVYCFGSLTGLKFLVEKPDWVIAMKWSSVIVFTVLGILSFVQKIKDPEKRSSGIGKGMIIAILNPLQIPFWLIWGVYVMQNNWVQPDHVSIIIFSIITAAGSLTILWLYSVVGRKLEDTLIAHQRAMNVVIGCVFIVLAAMELVKLVQSQN